MKPTPLIDLLRRSGIPRRVLHFYVTTAPRLWIRHTAACLDAHAGRPNPWPITRAERARFLIRQP